jgi:hypothetical protein
MSSQLLSAMKDEEVREVLEKIYKRAATDEEFRELAKKDPQAAFEVFDYDTNWNLQFVEPEEQESDDVLQLPPLVDVTEQLSEEELEAVAGGAAESCCCNTCATDSSALT